MLQTLINILRPLLLSVLQPQSSLSAEQLNRSIRQLLNYAVSLLVSAVMLVIIATFLIDRALDQLDQQILALSPSIILLLILLALDIVVIAVLLRSGKPGNTQPPAPQQSPLEHAVSILILDFVKEREVQRQQPPATTPDEQ